MSVEQNPWRGERKITIGERSLIVGFSMDQIARLAGALEVDSIYGLQEKLNNRMPEDIKLAVTMGAADYDEKTGTSALASEFIPHVNGAAGLHACYEAVVGALSGDTEEEELAKKKQQQLEQEEREKKLFSLLRTSAKSEPENSPG